MKKLFVPYEITLKLKELGFSEPTLNSYEDSELSCCGEVKNTMSYEDCIKLKSFPSPLWQQAIDFLRNKYLIHVCVDFENWSDYSKCFEYTTYLLYQSDYLTFKEKTEEYSEKVKCIVRRQDNPQIYFESYESAREAAILKAIEIINKNIANGK